MHDVQFVEFTNQCYMYKRNCHLGNLVGLKKANDMYDWKLNQQLCHVLMLLSYKTTINCTFDSKHSAEKDTTSVNNGEKKSISEVSGEKVFLFSG